jgi:hypothetical protein
MIHPAMNPRIVASVAFLALASFGFAGEKKPATEKIETGIWRLSPGLVTAADPAQKDGTRNPMQGFKREEKAGSSRYDPTEFLKSCDVTFPPGSEAIYDLNAQALVVRNTRANLDLVEVIMTNTFCPPVNLTIEISVFEARLPGDSKSGSSKWPAWHDLQQLPKGDRTLLGRISALTQSGTRISMSQVNLPGSNTPAAPVSANAGKAADSDLSFQPGESGIKAMVEAILGADGIHFGNTIGLCFRDARKNPASELTFTTDYAGWDGYPVVIHVSPAPGSPGKSLVVVATANVVNQGGWALNDLIAPGPVVPLKEPVTPGPIPPQF